MVCGAIEPEFLLLKTNALRCAIVYYLWLWEEKTWFLNETRFAGSVLLVTPALSYRLPNASEGTLFAVWLWHCLDRRRSLVRRFPRLELLISCARKRDRDC